MPCALLLKKIKLHFIYCMWVHVPWATWESWFSFFYHVGPRNQTRVLRLHLINGAKMIQGLAHARQVFHSSGTPAPHWQSLWRHSIMNYTLTISQTHRDRCKRVTVWLGPHELWAESWRARTLTWVTLKSMFCSEYQNTTAACSAGLKHTE